MIRDMDVVDDDRWEGRKASTEPHAHIKQHHVLAEKYIIVAVCQFFVLMESRPQL